MKSESAQKTRNTAFFRLESKTTSWREVFRDDFLAKMLVGLLATTALLGVIARLAQIRARLAQIGAILAQISARLAQMSSRLAQIGARLAQIGAILAQIGAKLA